MSHEQRRPSLVDLTDFALELVNNIDALRLRYWLGWLWQLLPDAVQAVQLQPHSRLHEGLVLVTDGVMSQDEYHRWWVLALSVVREMEQHGLAFDTDRRTHRPVDTRDVVVGLCESAVRALGFYARQGTPRQRFQIHQTLQCWSTPATSRSYQDAMALRLRQVIARTAVCRCVQVLPLVGVLHAVVESPLEGVTLPTGWDIALQQYGFQVPVLCRLIQAADLPRPSRREWLREIRRVHRYANPLHAALATLEVLQDLVGVLDLHSRVWVLEQLQALG